jgi:hypothetical protein
MPAATTLGFINDSRATAVCIRMPQQKEGMLQSAETNKTGAHRDSHMEGYCYCYTCSRVPLLILFSIDAVVGAGKIGIRGSAQERKG